MPVPVLYSADPFLAIQHALVTPWLDGPMELVTRACEGWAVGLIGCAWLVLGERASTASASTPVGRTAALARILRLFAPLVLALVAVGLAVQGLKALAHTPRPLAVYGPGAIHQLLEPLRCAAFPSGHSASVATLAAYGTGRYRQGAWPLWLFALAGGLSRIYVGAHWTIDVLGGFAVGVLFGWLAYVLAARVRLLPAARSRSVTPAGSAPPASRG